MAYFSALGGTGGTSATITVTYSEDFYGLTITATNGTTTLTKTATSSGTLVFDVSEGGTWVVSGTVEGATYSEQVDVFFEYTVPPLVALPDGSTALPVNDIQMWLKCAAIRDKTTYTTLADVLADTDTFIALCADSNASDYMARSTTWASTVCADATAMQIVGMFDYCANALLGNATWASAICGSSYASYVISALVPTMTSNTTPEGTCFGSTNEGATYDYYRAFDNSAKGWSPSSSDSFGTANCGYESPVPIIVTKWAIKEITSAFDRVYRLEGSNDGITYTPIKTSDAITTADSWVYFTFNNSTAYNYHRCVVVSGSQSINTGQGRKFQFYGRVDHGYTGTVIHSAVEDSIYYLDSGSPVTFCGIASGDTGTVLASTIEALKNQTVTLYSSVAKDPTNLSNDYSKSIRITPNITEIYLRPIDKVIYWYGYEDSNFTVSESHIYPSGYTQVAGVKNKNNVSITLTGVTYASVGTPNMLSNVSKAYCIISNTASQDMGYLALFFGNSLGDAKRMNVAYPLTTAIQLVGGDVSPYTSGYLTYMTNQGTGTTTATIHALWYE